MEAQEVAVRVRLLGGSAFQEEANKTATSLDKINAAGKRTTLGAIGAGATTAGRKVQSAGKAMTTFGASTVAAGRSLTMLGIPLAAVGYYSVKMASQTGQAMTLLQTQAGASAGEVKNLTEKTKNWSEQFGTTPLAIAQALYPIESVGARGKSALADLKAALLGTAVGLDSLENTTDAVTTLMSSHIKGVNGPVQAMATMDSAIGQGKMHLQDLTESFKSGIIPLSQAYGLSFQQIVAAEAALTREGIPANQVMNRMRLTLSSVVSPTKAGQAALSSMGLSQFALAEDLRKPGGLLTALEDLHQHSLSLDKNHRNAAISEIFGRSRGAGQIASLLNALPQMQGIYKTVLGADQQTLMAHFNETTHTAAFRFKQLKGAADQAMMSLGNAIIPELIPVLHTLVKDVEAFAHWFDHLSPSTKKLLIQIAALTIIFGPLLIVFGSLFKFIGLIIGGIGTLIGWFGAATTAVEGETVAFEALLGTSALGGFALTALTAAGILGGIAALGLAFYEAYKHVKWFHDMVQNALSILPGHEAKAGLTPKQEHKALTTGYGGLSKSQIVALQKMNPGGVVHFYEQNPGYLRGGNAARLTPWERHKLMGVFRSASPYSIQVKQTALAQLRGVKPHPQSASTSHKEAQINLRGAISSGLGNATIHVPVYLDGQKIAESVATVERKKANRR